MHWLHVQFRISNIVGRPVSTKHPDSGNLRSDALSRRRSSSRSVTLSMLVDGNAFQGLVLVA